MVSSSALLLARSSIDYAAGNTPSLINRGDVIRISDISLPLVVEEIYAPFPNVGTAIATRNNDGIDTGSIPDFNVVSWTRVLIRRPEPNLDLRRVVGKSLEFEIQRTPRPSIAQPIEMPTGTAIDLTASGVGQYGNQFSPFEAEVFPATAPNGNYVDVALPPFVSTQRDYRDVFILFNSRGEVSRVLTGVADGLGGIILDEVPLTGDVYLLVHESGSVKTDPEQQLEDIDAPNYVGDPSNDGTTPLLNPESIWVTVRTRSGDSIASPWIDPTAVDIPLVQPVPGTNTNQLQRQRTKSVISLTRSAAARLSDLGS